VITWNETKGSSSNIYARRFTIHGNPIGAKVQVNDDTSNLPHERPVVCAMTEGSFAITWSDKREETFNIYAQRFANNGSLIGSNIKVNSVITDSNNHSPFICSNSSGTFAISWQDSSSVQNIYAQVYSNQGTPVGENIRINDNDFAKNNSHPAIGIDNPGIFITWEADRNIAIQVLSPTGQRIAENRILSSLKVASRISPEIAVGNSFLFSTWASMLTADSKSDIMLYSLSSYSLGVNSTDIAVHNFDLHQNYPNPFNPTTTITFTISTSGMTTLKVYSVLGQEIAKLVNGWRQPGTYEVKFDGSKLSSGVYFYQLQTGKSVATKKLILLK
jgi:hypothetical protein